MGVEREKMGRLRNMTAIYLTDGEKILLLFRHHRFMLVIAKCTMSSQDGDSEIQIDKLKKNNKNAETALSDAVPALELNKRNPSRRQATGVVCFSRG